MSVGLEPVDWLEVVELLVELEFELDLLLLPHAASTAPNAATAPVEPRAVMKRLRDAGSRSSSSSADRRGGRSLSCVME
jgi:hypothetical protein